jgi:hypothetical protein
MDGCQVFIKEEMEDHIYTKDWDSSSATALIKEEMDVLEDVKYGDSASSSATLSFDEVIQFKVNWDFYIFIFNIFSVIKVVPSCQLLYFRISSL